MRQRWIGCLAGVLLLVGFGSPSGVSLAAEPDAADSLTPLYRYTEGIKQLHIVNDTLTARRLFEGALELDSTYAPAHFKLSAIDQEHHPASSIRHGEAAYRGDTTNKFYLQRYAQALVLNRQFREALSAYHRLIEIDRHNPDAYRLAALLEEQEGNPGEAVALLDSAEVLFGHQVPLGVLKFQILYEQRRFEEAEREVRKNILAEPQNPEHLISLAQIGLMVGCDSLSTVSLEQALALDSTNLRTLATLTHLYRKGESIDRYFSTLRLLFAHPDFPLEEKLRIHTEQTADLNFYRRYYLQIGSTLSVLGKLYPREEQVVTLQARHLMAMGEWEEALKLYKARIGDRPPVQDYYLAVIDLERYLERPDSANRYMEEAIRRFPKEVNLRLLRGHLAATQERDYRRAIAHYKEVFRLDANDSLRSVVWGLIGDLYQQEAIDGSTLPIEEMALQSAKNPSWQRAMKRCYAAYDKALEYNPDNISVMNNYAYFLSLEERDLEDALRLSSRVMELEGENPTYMDTHAWVLFKLGRLEEARQLLRRAVSRDGQKSPDLQVHYGDVLAALGEGFMAQTYWKRALENGYNAEGILRRIEQLKNRPTTP